MSGQTMAIEQATTATRRRRAGPWFLCGGLLIGLSVAFSIQLWHNFHVVVPGAVYRSAQLDSDGFEDVIGRYHIRTIINLRGENGDADWYRDECAVAERNHVRHVDIPTDSVSLLTLEELSQLLEILDAPNTKPILIHCQSGVNRTGIMAAMCVLLLEDTDGLAKARNQFRSAYGNFPWADSTRSCLAYLDQYENWLEENHLSHTPERFRGWALANAASSRVLAAQPGDR
jgi:protein-tyrosine phosphatase